MGFINPGSTSLNKIHSTLRRQNHFNTKIFIDNHCFPSPTFANLALIPLILLMEEILIIVYPTYIYKVFYTSQVVQDFSINSISWCWVKLNSEFFVSRPLQTVYGKLIPPFWGKFHSFTLRTNLCEHLKSVLLHHLKLP